MMEFLFFKNHSENRSFLTNVFLNLLFWVTLHTALSLISKSEIVGALNLVQKLTFLEMLKKVGFE